MEILATVFGRDTIRNSGFQLNTTLLWLYSTLNTEVLFLHFALYATGTGGGVTFGYP